MGFERFTQTGRSFVTKMSIWTKGQIGFSTGSVARYNLTDFEYVVFLYDKEAKKVGLVFTNDAKENGAVKLNKRKTGVMVGAKAFLDYYGIDYKETRQYEMQHDETNELYFADLNEAEKSD